MLDVDLRDNDNEENFDDEHLHRQHHQIEVPFHCRSIRLIHLKKIL